MKEKDDGHDAARRRRAPSVLTVEIPSSLHTLSSSTNHVGPVGTTGTVLNGPSGILSFLHPLKRATSSDDFFSSGNSSNPDTEISTPSKPSSLSTTGSTMTVFFTTLIESLNRQWRLASIAYSTTTLPHTPSSSPPDLRTRCITNTYAIGFFLTLVLRSFLTYVSKSTHTMLLRYTRVPSESNNDNNYTTDNDEYDDDEGYDPDVDDHHDDTKDPNTTTVNDHNDNDDTNRTSTTGNVRKHWKGSRSSRSLRSAQRKKLKQVNQSSFAFLCYRSVTGRVTCRCFSFVLILLILLYLLFVAPFHYDVEEAIDYYHDIIEYTLNHDIVCTTQYPILYSYTPNVATKEFFRAKQKDAQRYGWTHADLVSLLLTEGRTLSYTITLAEEDRANFSPCLRHYRQDREIPIRYIPASHMYPACKQTKFIDNVSDRPLFIWTRQDALWRHPYHGIENLFLIHSSIHQGICRSKNRYSETYCHRGEEKPMKNEGKETKDNTFLTARIFNPYPDGTLYTANNFAGLSAFLGYPYQASYSSMTTEYMLYPANPAIQMVFDELHGNLYGKDGTITNPNPEQTTQNYDEKYIPMGEIAPSSFCAPMGIIGTASANELLWKLPQSSYWYPDLSSRIRSFRNAVWGASLWWTNQANRATQSLLASSRFTDKHTVPVAASLPDTLSSSSSTLPRHVVIVLRGWGSRSSRPDLTQRVDTALADWNPYVTFRSLSSTTDTENIQLPSGPTLITEWLSSAAPAIGTDVSSLCASTRRFDNEEDMFNRLPRLLDACNVRKILSEEEGEYYEDLFSGQNTPEAWIPPCTADPSSSSSSSPPVSITFVRLEVLPFAYQVLLARSADVFVGGHGAAMVHGLWMRPSGSVNLFEASSSSTARVPNDRKGILVELFPEASATLQLYSNLAQLAGAGYVRSYYKRTDRYEKRYLACAQYRGFLWTVARNVPFEAPTRKNGSTEGSSTSTSTKSRDGDFASRSVPAENIYWWKGLFNHPLTVEDQDGISETDTIAYEYGQQIAHQDSTSTFRNAALVALSTVLTAENILPHPDTIHLWYQKNKDKYGAGTEKKGIGAPKHTATLPRWNGTSERSSTVTMRNPVLTKAHIQETLQRPLHPLARAAVGEARVGGLEERLFMEGAGQLAGWSSPTGTITEGSSVSPSAAATVTVPWIIRVRNTFATSLSYLFSFFSPGEEWRVMVKDADIFIDIETMTQTIKEGFRQQEK